jgi:hypothetical protein
MVFYGGPIAWSAWYAQKGDGIIVRLRYGLPINLPDSVAAIDAFDRAVAIDPSASLRLVRSELLVGAAAGLNWAASDSQREQWVHEAEADLEASLGQLPARGIGWLRLAAVRETLDGPSPAVVGPLLMSIETAPVVPHLWPVRLELILQNWGMYTDAERERIAAYVAMTWQASTDRRWFVGALRTSLDELYLRLLLGNEPGVQDELTMWLELSRR